MLYQCDFIAVARRSLRNSIGSRQTAELGGKYSFHWKSVSGKMEAYSAVEISALCCLLVL